MTRDKSPQPEIVDSIPGTSYPVREMVQQGLNVMRLENETQISLAIQRPRSEEKVLKEVLSEMEIVPQIAATYIYSIPYKKADGSTENVRGLSIKAAMSIINRWGNNANGARVIDELPDRIKIEGVVLDFETGTRIQREISVSRKAWSKKLNMHVNLDPTRLNLAIQAGMSKAVRNAILARIPEYIKAAVFSRSVDIASGKFTGKKNEQVVPVANRIENAIKKFVSAGAKPEWVKAYIDGLAVETQEEVLTDLIGLWNAIADGQTTIQEAFIPEGSDEKKEAVPGQVNLQSVMGEAKS